MPQSHHQIGGGIAPGTISLAVATPSLRETFTGYYLRSTHDLHQQCHYNNINFTLLMSGRVSLIAHARNTLVSQFLLETNCSHILFVDDDIGFNAPDIIKMLRYADYPLIGAIYPRREINWDRVREIAWQNPTMSALELSKCASSFNGNVQWLKESPDLSIIAGESPFEVSFVGTGLMLIARSTLLALIEAGRAPKLTVPDTQTGVLVNHTIYEFFRSYYDDGGVLIGEDMHFCQQVRSVGLSVYAYGAIHTVHSGASDYFGHPSIMQKFNINPIHRSSK